VIVELAILYIKENESDAFEKAFYLASSIIASMDGYIKHDLKKCIEKENKYLLLVHWTTIEAHEIGFRKSDKYQEWKKLLHHFYDPFPEVEHYV
jgi:heme-degrading monooxygenase HmoA